MEEKKKLLWTLLVSIAAMAILPFVAEYGLRDGDGMNLMLLSYFAINPLLAVCIGIFAGRNIKKRWAFPAVPAAVCILAQGVLFRGAFAVLGLVYLGIGGVVMLLTWKIYEGLVKGRKRAEQILEEEKRQRKAQGEREKPLEKRR